MPKSACPAGALRGIGELGRILAGLIHTNGNQARWVGECLGYRLGVDPGDKPPARVNALAGVGRDDLGLPDAPHPGDRAYYGHAWSDRAQPGQHIFTGLERGWCMGDIADNDPRL